MKNHLIKTMIAVTLAAASTGAFAADQGAFFINGNLGQSTFHDRGFSNNTDTSSALRVGYRWQTDPAMAFGLEAGYVNLGTATGSTVASNTVVDYSAKVTGPLLGGNFKYTFANRMYVSARLGWFRSKFDASIPLLGSQSVQGDGAYIGAGVGYDISRNFSVGVSFDQYHGRATFYGTKTKESISSLSGFAEVRF